jgi:hypothetical protein
MDVVKAPPKTKCISTPACRGFITQCDEQRLPGGSWSGLPIPTRPFSTSQLYQASVVYELKLARCRNRFTVPSKAEDYAEGYFAVSHQFGCPPGIRTPITCSRGRCPTIERGGSKRMEVMPFSIAGSHSMGSPGQGQPERRTTRTTDLNTSRRDGRLGCPGASAAGLDAVALFFISVFLCSFIPWP